MHDSKYTSTGRQSSQTNETSHKDCACDEYDSITQIKTINKLREDYCTQMYVARGEVSQWEEKWNGYTELFKNKKCWFSWTEKNYRLYRNLDLEIGVELVQTNDSIKENIKSFLDLNKSLSETLKGIAKSAKEIKSKMSDLNDMACKLENCKNDVCSCSQMIELTGEAQGNCKDKGEPKKGERPKDCEHAKAYLENLICMPKNLMFDMDSIFKASYDVVGIQMFSNISTLDPMQKTLEERSKSLDKLLQDAIKRGEADTKKAQDEMRDTGKNLAKAEVALYNKRTYFEGIKEAVAFYCCSCCDCINDDAEDCGKRLHDCECKICEICGKVTQAFCSDDNTQNPC